MVDETALLSDMLTVDPMYLVKTRSLMALSFDFQILAEGTLSRFLSSIKSADSSETKLFFLLIIIKSNSIIILR